MLSFYLKHWKSKKFLLQKKTHGIPISDVSNWTISDVSNWTISDVSNWTISDVSNWTISDVSNWTIIGGKSRRNFSRVKNYS